MTQLGNGLSAIHHYEDALAVQEAELSMLRRLGTPEANILDVHCNLAVTYAKLGRDEEALRLERDVYSKRVRLDGEEHVRTILAALNYSTSLITLERFEEAKALLRKTMPVARRVLGESSETALRMRWVYAAVLYNDPGATLDDLREAATTLEVAERIARRVLGGAHPITVVIERHLGLARAAVRARDTPGSA